MYYKCTYIYSNIFLYMYILILSNAIRVYGTNRGVLCSALSFFSPSTLKTCFFHSPFAYKSLYLLSSFLISQHYSFYESFIHSTNIS